MIFFCYEFFSWFWVFAIQPTVHNGGVIAGGGSVAVAIGVSERWQVTRDMWHVTPDTWHVTPDTRHVHFCPFLSFLVLVIQSLSYAVFLFLKTCFCTHISPSKMYYFQTVRIFLWQFMTTWDFNHVRIAIMSQSFIKHKSRQNPPILQNLDFNVIAIAGQRKNIARIAKRCPSNISSVVNV